MAIGLREGKLREHTVGMTCQEIYDETKVSLG